MADAVRLPDPLVMRDGRPVVSEAMWMDERRPELLGLFRSHVYGRNPVDRPADLAWTVDAVDGDAIGGTALYKVVHITFSGPGGQGGMNLHLTLPKGAEGPLPVMLLIDNRGVGPGPNGQDPTGFWPVEAIVGRGYAAAFFHNSDLDPDNDDGFKDGVHGVFDTVRDQGSWGTIAAWAWGASRAMDYLETDPAIDASRVAVVGHSRGGKTALWAAAQDERFAMAVGNESGNSGAAISRITRGEKIRDIIRAFSFWFCGRYAEYVDREGDLPIDQHELLALIAPRLLYVASAEDDAWADPSAEYASCVEASRVYRFLGLEGVGPDMPGTGEPRHRGRIGYHVRKGGHDLTPYDWNLFMDFADRHLR